MAGPLILISVIGLDKIVGDIDSFPGDSARVYSKAVDDAAKLLVKGTKNMPPVSAATTGYGRKGMPVDTGALRGSIQKREIGLMASGVFAKADYSGFVHEGTSRMPARPFFQWALDFFGVQLAIDKIFAKATAKLL